MCQGKIELHPSSIMEIRDDNVRAALILIQTPWLHTSPQASGKDEGVPGSDHPVMQTHATRAPATCQQVHALRVHVHVCMYVCMYVCKPQKVQNNKMSRVAQKGLNLTKIKQQITHSK